VGNEGPRIAPKLRRLATAQDRPGSARAKARAPAATAATSSTGSAAATVTVPVAEPVTAGGLCAGREPVKNPGVCALPITHNLAKRQNEREGERDYVYTHPLKNDRLGRRRLRRRHRDGYHGGLMPDDYRLSLPSAWCQV
jgi:hypothetical protein